MRRFIASVTAALLSACSSDSTGASSSSSSSSSSGSGEVAGSVPVGTSNPNGKTNPSAACTTVVTVGLYGDDTCTPGTEKMLIKMNLAQDCYGWSRQSDRGNVDNSATRLQCYRDRICYTQHTETLDCNGARRTDKETRTDGCTLEPQGGLWTRLLGGMEGCPEAPAGFACPISPAQSGTDGIQPAKACK